MALTMMLATRWQQVAIDQTSPMNEATSLAGTARWLKATTALRLTMLSRIFFSLEDVTLKRKDLRSTIVPRTFMACLGKKEHFEIFRDNPKAADSKTMRIAIFIACRG